MTTKRVLPRPEDDAEQLRQFAATRDPAVREALILRYVPLVHFVLGRLGLSPASGPDYEDLASQGLLGLIDAVDRYDLNYGAQFSTYATVRVRGRVLDQLRQMDWLSRAARRRARDVQTGLAELWPKLNRAPTEEELAEHLKVSLTDLRRTLADSDRVLLSLDMAVADDVEGATLHEVLADEQHLENADPAELQAESELHQRLVRAIQDLPDREQLVLSLYYHDELTLKEIGVVLELSESRVCQLHARAVLSLRALLADAPVEAAQEQKVDVANHG